MQAEKDQKDQKDQKDKKENDAVVSSVASNEFEKKLSETLASLKDKEKLIEDYTNQLKRLQAEFENYIKRVEKERKDFEDFVKQKLFSKLLTFVDDLERAVKQSVQTKSGDLVRGFEIVLNNLHKFLKEEHVCAIEAKGKKFDPFVHEVITVVEDQLLPENTVSEEIQKGYMFKDKILRHSKVVICKNCLTKK